MNSSHFNATCRWSARAWRKARRGQSCTTILHCRPPSWRGCRALPPSKRQGRHASPPALPLALSRPRCETFSCWGQDPALSASLPNATYDLAFMRDAFYCTNYLGPFRISGHDRRARAEMTSQVGKVPGKQVVPLCFHAWDVPLTDARRFGQVFNRLILLLFISCSSGKLETWLSSGFTLC